MLSNVKVTTWRQRPAQRVAPDLTSIMETLTWLSERGRIVGSWARGRVHSGSDIDVYVPLRVVQELKRHLDEQAVKWDSPITGAITWWPDGVQVEVSDLFRREKSRGERVDVWGVEFRT